MPVVTNPAAGERRTTRMRTMSAGERAPDFELPDQLGQPRSLRGLLGTGSVVLFFYPVALSSGCTVEACHFRDLAAEFTAVGAQPVGISMDGVTTQREFDERDSLRMPLLSDSDGSVAISYGVRRRFLTPVKRASFVIGRDQQIIEVVQSELSMQTHADTALKVLSALE